MKSLRVHSLGAVALLTGLASFSAYAQEADFELISPSQSQAEQQALSEAGPAQGKLPSVRTRAILPSIKVLAPALGVGPLKSPVRIELTFEPAGEAKINTDSFRVLYGVFKLDLTNKIREHAKISEAGVIAERAKIPAGEHKLLIQIADELGRQAETELRFKVEN